MSTSLTASGLASSLMPYLREMKTQSSTLLASVNKVEAMLGTMQGAMNVAIADIEGLKKALGDVRRNVASGVVGSNASLELLKVEVSDLKGGLNAMKVLVGILGESSEVMSRNVECLQKWTVAFEYDQRFTAGATTSVAGVETLMAPVTVITKPAVPVPDVSSMAHDGTVAMMSPVVDHEDQYTMCVPSSLVMTNEDVTEFLKSLNEEF